MNIITLFNNKLSEEIKELVKQYPNNSQLEAAVRSLINSKY